MIMIAASHFSLYCQTTSKTLQLWSGGNLERWEFVDSSGTDIHSICRFDSENVLSVVGKPIGYLATRDAFENYKLHLEYRWAHGAAKNSNSGILVHIASDPLKRGLWPICFQVQMKISRAGDILPMAGAAFAEPLSTPPGAKTPILERRESDSEKPVGEWNIIEIICKKDTLTAVINGVTQNQITKCQPYKGSIGIQLEGTPFALRNIWLTPLE